MSLLAPAGLFALLGLPAVLALHLFRRRPRTRRVSALFLFADAPVRSEAGRRRQPLRRSASLWLELLAVILLALWLAEPRLGIGVEPTRLVVILDGSASMLALRGDGTSARDRAARAVVGLLDDLPADAEISVLISGSRPDLVAGPAARVEEAKTALARWQPRASAFDPDPSLELGLELGGDHAEVLFVTDGELRAVPPRVRVLGFGAAAANLAVAGARRILAPNGRARVLCEVTSFGLRGGAAVTLLGADGAERARREIEFDADAPRHVTFEIDDEDAAFTLHVHADGDALGIDDSCALPPPARRTVRIGVELPPQLRAALELDRVLTALEGVLETAPADADLMVITAPTTTGRGSELLVRGAEGETDPWLGPFLVDRREPLANGLTLEGVLWVAGRGDLPGARFVMAGDQPLASVERLADDRLRVHLELDPLRSNLQRSPDWPILLQNMVEAVRASLPGPERAVQPVGTTARWRGDVDRVEGPDGKDLPLLGGRVHHFEMREPGLYRVHHGGSEVGSVAAWFVDAAESDLRARRSFERAPMQVPERDTARSAVGRDTERRILGLLLLAVILFDIFVLASRSSSTSRTPLGATA